MYLRRTERRTKDGSVGYLQLAHNEWDPVAKHSKVRVLYNFGRENELDRQAIVRLIGSLQRALEPDQALQTAAAPGLRFLESRPMGGAWALDRIWQELAVDRTLQRLLQSRRRAPHPGSRSAVVANPSSVSRKDDPCREPRRCVSSISVRSTC